MRTSLATLALTGVLFFVFAAAQARRCPDVPAMTEAARNGDAGAIEGLRSYGPAGLKSFIEANREDIERYRASAAEGAGRFGAGDRWAGLVNAIDTIAGQYDAAWSELYWFTNFEEAKELAQRSGKPILSLRLLGRLDEELSCANSRFFRSTLYANETVAALLRDRFILHWESVRPAPVITIDYGDGRTLKTTITGNSIHYVLTPDGQVVDALPGLWSPEDFVTTLKSADATVQAAAQAPAEFQPILASYWDREIRQLEAERKLAGLWPPAARERLGRQDAMAAAFLAMSKAGPEFEILRRMAEVGDGNASAQEAQRWAAAAWTHGATPQFDQRSRSLMRSQTPPVPNEAVSNLMLGAMANSVRMDSLRNRLDLRHWILSDIQNDPSLAASLAQLNTDIYEMVFATPLTDRWMGMFDPNRYSAVWGSPASAPSPLVPLAQSAQR